MTLLEKLKVNINYLLGKGDPSLYSNKESIGLRGWQKRWEEFSADGCGFYWFGIDIEGNIAEFSCEQSYVPETFFEDAEKNRLVLNYFDNLPDVTETLIPENLRPELRKLAEKHNDKGFWVTGADKGLFIFDESDKYDWYDFENDIQHYYDKNPYELLLIPHQPLKVDNLPVEIQKYLKHYHFIDISFTECQFLDVSKHIYCVD